MNTIFNLAFRIRPKTTSALIALGFLVVPSVFAQWSMTSGTITYGGGASFHYDAGTYPPTNFTYTNSPPTYIAYVFTRPDGSEQSWSGPLGGSPGAPVGAGATANFDQYGTWTVTFWWLENSSAGVWRRGNAISSYQFTVAPSTYTLMTSTADDGTGGIGTVTQGGTYNAGDTATIQALPDPGSSFVQWLGDASGSGNPITVSMTANKNVVAEFHHDTPPNTAPTVSLTVPATVTTGEDYMVSASAHDNDQNLLRVTIVKDGSSFASAGGGNGYDSSASGTTTDGSPGTITYTATVTDTGGLTANDTKTVTIVAPAAVSISASPTTTFAPGSTTISWSSSNATSISVSGPNLITSSDPSGSQTVGGLSAGDYTYTITGQDFSGPITESVTVHVDAPATVSISASPTSTSAPGTTTISWSSSNATSISVSGPNLVTSSAPSGSQTLGGLPAGDHTYTITGQSLSGPTTQSVTVHVDPPVTAAINVSPSSCTTPGAVTISWASENATAVSVIGFELISTAINGSQSVSGLTAGTYNYTITAQGPNGPTTKTATVTVETPNHTVFVAASPPGTGSVVGAGTYPEGAGITLTASSDSTHVFTDWTGDIKSSSNPLTFTLGPQDYNVIANFAPLVSPVKIQYRGPARTLLDRGTIPSRAPLVIQIP